MTILSKTTGKTGPLNTQPIETGPTGVRAAGPNTLIAFAHPYPLILEQYCSNVLKMESDMQKNIDSTTKRILEKFAFF